MAAGDTGISICSDALIMLGAKAITSFNDGTDESSTCDRLYGDIRDSTLATYPWTFSFKKIQLAQLLTNPTSVWKYQYQLPGDKISNPRAVYNLTSVYIDYQYSLGEFAMPQYFVQLLKYMMSWHLAMPITEQTDKAQYWQRVAVGDISENGRGGYFRTAMQIDGQNNPVRVMEDYSLIAVRN